MPEITSPSNDKVKWVRQLHKSSTRKKLGLFIVEGHKEIDFALAAGYKPHSFYGFGQIGKLPADTYSLSHEAYEKISYRSGEKNNLLGVFYQQEVSLAELKLGAKPFLLVVEGVEKPGNLGAIIRTADGAGADGVIVTDPLIDIYNPNVIRASLGTFFSKPIIHALNQEFLYFAQTNKLALFGAALTPAAQAYTTSDFNQPLALLMGAEATGLSDFWLQHAQPIIIPMLGQNDSLNVSAAAAVLAYEVLRQRS